MSKIEERHRRNQSRFLKEVKETQHRMMDHMNTLLTQEIETFVIGFWFRRPDFEAMFLRHLLYRVRQERLKLLHQGHLVKGADLDE